MSKTVPLNTPMPPADEDTTMTATLIKSLIPRPQASIKKVAALLDFSDRHVRNLCACGELEYTGRLRGFRIYLDSVAAYQERESKKTRRAN